MPITIPRPHHRFPRRPSGAALLLLIGTLSLGGCAWIGEPGPSGTSPDGTAAGGPSVSSLQQIADSAANGGNVNVRFIEGVAYVTGRVDSALEEGAIKRSLRRVDGVERVETQLQREM